MINKHAAFTYLIGWSVLDRWYYGVKWAKGCNPADLWVKYFTSSKVVAAMRLEHGEPDVVEIRQVFDDNKSARIWEERVIDRLKAVNSPRWLNRANKGRDFAQAGERSNEHRMKLSIANKGKVFGPHSPAMIEKYKEAGRKMWMNSATAERIRSAHKRATNTPEYKETMRVATTALSNDPVRGSQWRDKISVAMQGREFTQDWRDKISTARTGIVFSDDTKSLMSKAKTGKPSNNKWSPEARAKLAATWAKRKEAKEQAC